MSNWETPEQRQIRELRQNITRLEAKRNQVEKHNKELEKQNQQIHRDVVQMSKDYTRRLEEEERRRREQDERIKTQSTQIQELHAEVREKERLQTEKLAQMEKQHKEQITQMKKENQKETEKLKHAIASTREDMQTGFSQLRKERDRKLAEQKKELKQEIQKVESKMQEEVKKVDSKVESLVASIQKKENGEKELAVYWTEQANRLLNEIEQYRPELFAPKEFSRLQEKIHLAEYDLQQSRFSSAVDGGRAVFYDALQVKETVVQAEMEWNQWFYELKHKEEELLRMLDSAEQRVYELEIDGETVQEDNGIDYWVNGQLSMIQERTAKFRQEELSDLKNRETAYLQKKTEELMSLMEELIQVENAAHTNVAMSLNRYQLAGKIGDILGEEYQMIDSDGDFFGEENRDEYHAVFENPITRDQVAVVITPVAGTDGVVSNHIELIVGNVDNNPLTREHISRSVQSKLNEKGILEGGFPCSQKYGDQTAEEVKRVGNIADVSAGKVSVRASTKREAPSAGISAVTGQTGISGKGSVKSDTVVKRQ